MDISNLPQFKYVMQTPNVNDKMRQTMMRFQPMGWYNAGANSLPNNYINFNFTTEGFWDPQSVYINIEVDSSDMPDHTVYQIDNSAQTLIGQYIARVNGHELMRIQEYDELASFLYDLHLGGESRDSRGGEGIGRNKVTTNSMSAKSSNASGTFAKMGTFPNFGWGADFNEPLKGWVTSALTNSPFKPWTTWQRLNENTNLATSLPGNFQSYLEIFANDDSQGCSLLFLDTPGTRTTLFSDLGGFSEKTKECGFSRLGTESSVGTGEFYLSNYVLKPTVLGGLPVSIKSTKASFQIPLLCPIFGSLATHGKLLPMKLFNNLEFEFLINPYAFFVGGSTSVGAGMYRDEATFDGLKQQSDFSTNYEMKPRTNWSITRFEICVELLFPSANETASIINRLQGGGFRLDFKSWFLGPKQKFASGTSNTTVQINNGFTSLNLLAFYFQPDDYEKFSFCRKHKRISNNLTSMQLRIGTEYIPSLPITGHSGNLRAPTYKSQGNYIEFYVSTMKAFGKWLKMGSQGIINPTNYTLNVTGYNPNKQNDFDTRADMSLFHENNIVPRNIYAFDLERFDTIENLRSGTNTLSLRPFDLLLSNDNSAITFEQRGNTLPGVNTGTEVSAQVTLEDTAFPRNVNMYIWLYYDAQIAWTMKDGWRVEGRV